MRNLLFLLITFCAAKATYSQDLIVTTDGDSINCKITKVKTDNVYFTFKHKDEIRNTLLPIAKIKSRQFDYYKKVEVPNDKVIGNSNYQHFRFAASGGFSYQTARVAESVPSVFKDYIKELKSGYHFGADFTYYFSEVLGFGFKYQLFKSSNSLDNIYIEDANQNRIYGKMSDDVSVSFIGPTFSTRLLNDNKTNAFITNFSLGYIDYTNDKVIVNSYTMTGNAIGLSFDIGYDIGLSENVALGFQISYTTGTLFEYDWNDGTRTETIKLESGEYESLNRIDFSVGLRFLK